MELLIVGATGLVGRNVLQQALADPAVAGVVAPVRRRLELQHPKLEAPVVDFDQLPEDAAWWRADAVVCTLGTTMRAAGSREAFRRVDHDYPLAVARLAQQHGAPTFVLNSAMGAHADSRVFYNRVKGELERDLESAGFDSLTFVRPGLIGGERDESRPLEHASLRLLQILAPVVPRKWRINPAETIASALLAAAIEATPGRHTVESGALVGG